MRLLQIKTACAVRNIIRQMKHGEKRVQLQYNCYMPVEMVIILVDLSLESEDVYINLTLLTFVKRIRTLL